MPLPPTPNHAAVESYALSRKLKRVPGPDPQYEDICFGDAPAHDDLEALSKVFPSMEIQFDQVWRGGGSMEAGRFGARHKQGGCG